MKAKGQSIKKLPAKKTKSDPVETISKNAGAAGAVAALEGMEKSAGPLTALLFHRFALRRAQAQAKTRHRRSGSPKRRR